MSVPYSFKDDSHYGGCLAEAAAPRRRNCLGPGAGYPTGWLQNCHFGVGLTCVDTLGIDALECPLGSQFRLGPGNCCLPLTQLPCVRLVGRDHTPACCPFLITLPMTLMDAGVKAVYLCVVFTLSIVFSGMDVQLYTGKVPQNSEKMLNSSILTYVSILQKNK